MGRGQPAEHRVLVPGVQGLRMVPVAHIRRRARHEGGFSEMALYVLAKRDGEWWLAAAQNTAVAGA